VYLDDRLFIEPAYLDVVAVDGEVGVHALDVIGSEVPLRHATDSRDDVELRVAGVSPGSRAGTAV